MTALILFLTSVLIGYCTSRDQLRLVSYTKLLSYPPGLRHASIYKLNGGTAVSSAYDAHNHMLYVVGDTSSVIHVLDFSDPTDPKVLLDHIILRSHGTPRSVAVCAGEIAVAMTTSAFDGHVNFYTTYQVYEKQISFKRSIPVGYFPVHVSFSKDCRVLIVSNQGVPGIDPSHSFVDPEGSVTVLVKDRSGWWREQTADFLQYNNRLDIRHPSQCVNNTVVSNATLAEDLEPSYAVISPDGKRAFISLPVNNGIAEVSTTHGVVTKLHNLGVKNWNTSRIDVMDSDGGVNLNTYPIYGLYQPRVMRLLESAGKLYLVTANEGHVRQYTVNTSGLDWSDAVRCGSLTFPLNNNNHTLADMLKPSGNLGHLLISRCDGMSGSALGKIHSFGGRGFSIWDTTNMVKPVYDSGSEIEEINQLLLDNVFNTDVTSSITSSPEDMRDSTSDDMGPRITALDILKDRSKTYLLIGSGTMGSLYLYTVDPGTLVTDLQHVHREGGTRESLKDLYTKGILGDAGISDIQLVASHESPLNKTLAFVTSSVSGSVAVYEIDSS